MEEEFTLKNLDNSLKTELSRLASALTVSGENQIRALKSEIGSLRDEVRRLDRNVRDFKDVSVSIQNTGASNMNNFLLGLQDRLDGNSRVTNDTMGSSLLELRKLIERMPKELVGGFVHVKNGVVEIGTSETLVLSDNQNREFALFTNDGDIKLNLSLGEGAITGRGIVLNANGGSYEINRDNLYKGKVTGVHGGSGRKNLLVVEGSGD